MGYCSFASLHCSCPTNSARGGGLNKKKEKKNAEAGHTSMLSKRYLNLLSCIRLNKKHMGSTHELNEKNKLDALIIT